VSRLALFSDIHGNSQALSAVLADIEGRDLSGAYCLGDLVGYGADPNGVIDVIRRAGVPAILGNYDEGVAWETGDCGCFYLDEEAKRVGAASYAYTVSAVTDANKAWLRGLPRELHVPCEDKLIHLVHGSPRRVNEYLLRERDAKTYERLAAAETDDVLVFGHTHQFWQRRFGHVLFVNVGTVGRPKDGDPRAGYVTVDLTSSDVVAESVRVAYDVEAAAAAILQAGLPASLAEGLRAGS
jgi:predicted phosphodiesterase